MGRDGGARAPDSRILHDDLARRLRILQECALINLSGAHQTAVICDGVCRGQELPRALADAFRHEILRLPARKV